jgi:hypothetical protein
VRALKRPGGIELYVRDFLVPSGTQAKALIVMVHGWSWHSRYFQPAAEHFTQQGDALCYSHQTWPRDDHKLDHHARASMSKHWAIQS